MSQTNPASTDPNREISRATPDDTFKRTVDAFGKLVEKITPWLLDLGNWIFGALIAFNLVILGALLTVGPVDPAIIVSTGAFALALPADAAGFFLLRLVADLKHVGLEEIATQAFQEVGFTVENQVSSPAASESIEKRRTGIVLRYSYALLAVSVLLTLVGMTAALWHMAWWIAVMFVAMVVASQGVVFGAIVSSGSTATRRTPTGAEEARSRQKGSRT